VGGGSEAAAVQAMAASLRLVPHVRFHGWLPRPEIEPLYAQSHLLLFPSAASEGWPKVIGEAMAHGVVPLAGNVSCIATELRNFGCGQVVSATAEAGFAEAIATYWHHPERVEREACRAHDQAHVFTYENYLMAVKEMLGLLGKAEN
jgi:glycosyltransferase involved in cell wall biosynthesis